MDRRFTGNSPERGRMSDLRARTVWRRTRFAGRARRAREFGAELLDQAHGVRRTKAGLQAASLGAPPMLLEALDLIAEDLCTTAAAIAALGSTTPTGDAA